jgi:O-antigen ligase
VHKTLTILATVISNIYLAASCGLFAVLFVSANSVTSAVGSNSQYMASWLILYSLSLLCLAVFKFKVTTRDVWVLIIPVFHFISFFWSGNPQKTFIYSSCFILNALFVITLTRFMTPEKLIKNIFFMLLTMMMLGLILYVLGYENVKYLDIHDRGNLIGSTPIRGLFNHKITAGLYAVIAFMIAFILLTGLRKIITLAFCAFFIIVTGSATAAMLALVGILCILGIKFAAKRRVNSKTFIFAIILGLFSSVSIFSLIAEPVLVALNRDPTLTGRTVLWDWGIRVALEKLIFGWGYLGYLGTNLAKMAAGSYIEFRNYDVPHFHSSIIQILVDGGIIYTTFLFGSIFYCIQKWYRHYLDSNDTYSLIFTSTLLLLLLGSFFIYYFSRYNDFATIFTMLAIALMPRKIKSSSVGTNNA